MSQSSKTVIPAHTSNLVAISFSPCGRRVATSSEKGTVIRIFNVDDGGSRIYELRRGLKRTVNIYRDVALEVLSPILIYNPNSDCICHI